MKIEINDIVKFNIYKMTRAYYDFYIITEEESGLYLTKTGEVLNWVNILARWPDYSERCTNTEYSLEGADAALTDYEQRTR